MRNLADRVDGLLALAFCIVLTSCASPSPPVPPSLEVPKPVSDLKAVRVGNKVYLSWTVPSVTTDHQTVRHLGATRVCRSLEATMTQCGAPTGEVATGALLGVPAPSKKSTPAPIAAAYVDSLPEELQQRNPYALLTYSVETMNEAGRSSGLSNLARTPAVEAPPPPAHFEGEVTADGVEVRWVASPEVSQPDVSHVYRIYRREEGSTKPSVAGEIGFGENHFSDRSFEWEKNYVYYATSASLVTRPGQPSLQAESQSSDEIRLFTHDVFPPSVPASVQAAFSGTQQPFVDLIWAPDTEPDLAGYNIYRHEPGGTPVKINSELVKLPAYRDTAIESGRKYFYSISAVDTRGNESGGSGEAEESVP
jgi:hypothetical protein